jgi:hypothetical protein
VAPAGDDIGLNTQAVPIEIRKAVVVEFLGDERSLGLSIDQFVAMTAIVVVHFGAV